MRYTKIVCSIAILIFTTHISYSKSWIDSLDVYARESFMPPSKFKWNWMKASLIHAMVKQYDNGNTNEQKIYLDYIKNALDKKYNRANGKTPNAVASGLGMAFLYRTTHQEKYKKACDKIYSDYLKIKRTKEGAVSHLRKNIELWDDTIFMIGQFLLEMYRATNDEKYLEEFVKQVSLHREKLQDTTIGLWFHGWDNDNKSHCTFCGQINWADNENRRSTEIWGRGNGWIVVTLSDALETIPRNNAYWNTIAAYLKEMLVNLPSYQNKKNGHWFQLTLRPNEPKNYIESSSTAMFAYGITKAIKLGLLSDTTYQNSIDLAYTGLRNNSIQQKTTKYITTKNVCKGTCIGNKEYYLNRKVKNEKPYSIGMFINFGRAYQKLNKNYYIE